MPEYIPYSIRNNIKDPELAGLFDYCERVMGWDINDSGYEDLLHGFGSEKHGIHINIWYDQQTQIFIPGKEREMVLPTDLFYKTYSSILPNIRDLYSK